MQLQVSLIVSAEILFFKVSPDLYLTLSESDKKSNTRQAYLI